MGTSPASCHWHEACASSARQEGDRSADYGFVGVPPCYRRWFAPMLAAEHAEERYPTGTKIPNVSRVFIMFEDLSC